MGEMGRRGSSEQGIRSGGRGRGSGLCGGGLIVEGGGGVGWRGCVGEEYFGVQEVRVSMRAVLCAGRGVGCWRATSTRCESGCDGMMMGARVWRARVGVLLHGGQNLGMGQARRAERLVEKTTRSPCMREH